MKIATWNLESLNKLRPSREAAFREAMAAIDADVWILTETWVGFSPGEGYRLVAESYAAKDLETQPDRCWAAIWSRWDAEIQTVKGQSDRMACGRFKNSGHQDVVVVGTVLPWRSDQLWPGVDGFCAALTIQAEEWSRLWGACRAAAFVVAGDFNQSLPHQNHYGSKQGAIKLEQALEDHGLMCVTTGNDPLSGNPRIDHICINRSGRNPEGIPVGTWLIPRLEGKPITDHAGVYADFD